MKLFTAFVCGAAFVIAVAMVAEHVKSRPPVDQFVWSLRCPAEYSQLRCEQIAVFGRLGVEVALSIGDDAHKTWAEMCSTVAACRQQTATMPAVQDY